MVDSAIHAELMKALEQLSQPQQNTVLNFARLLSTSPTPKGTKGVDLLKFAGTLPAEDAEEMRAAIEEEFERIDPNDW